MANDTNIAFVCLHGSAKSLIAAEFCKRLAAERGTTLQATTSGPEPDVERWDDCPAFSDDYPIARDFIAGRVARLLQRLTR